MLDHPVLFLPHLLSASHQEDMDHHTELGRGVPEMGVVSEASPSHLWWDVTDRRTFGLLLLPRKVKKYL